MTMLSRRKLTIGLLVLGSLASVAFWEPQVPRDDVALAEAPVLAPVYAPPPERVETHVVRRGQTLSGVLADASFGGSELYSILLGIREHTDPRRLAAGVEITIRRWLRDDTPRTVDLRLNADTTLRLSKDEVMGWVGGLVETPVVLDTIVVAGDIESGQSLYHSLVELDDPAVPAEDRISLVSRLARVYEYKLDFLHDIQPGDRYHFVYERESRPDGSSRRQRIIAAEFENRGELHEAVFFDTGEVADYFDGEGRSLRTAFRRYPLEYVRITSSFSWRRYHPVLGIYRAHVGTDFGAPTGTPVLATGAGMVEFAGQRGGYGNLIILRHPAGYSTRYAHLRGFARGLRAGQRVQQGEVIGYVGMTGTATGPHLHYEFRRNGNPVDARSVELPRAEPVPAPLREAFQQLRAERLNLLGRAEPADSAAPESGLLARFRSRGGAAGM